MIDLLIFTQPWDMHALVIAAAAEELGACTKCIQALDFPLKARSSMAIPGSGAVSFSFKSDHEDKLIESGALPRNVWVRRIPDVTVHPDLELEDRRFARTESIVYVKSVLHLLKAQGSRLVNDPSSAEAADIKPLQLHAARQCGLAVPDILLSNSIEDVRTFVEQQDSCIVKSARPFQWGPAGEQPRRSNYTAVVNPALLEQASLVEAAPQIYQRRILGKEIRALVMGDQLLAAAVNSSSAVDVRLDRNRDYQIDPHLLCASESASILALCRRLGLAMGSLDLIRGEDGVLYFLEINEQGQWIFLAQQNEFVPVVEMALKFLLGEEASSISAPDPRLGIRHLTTKIMRRTDYVNFFNQHGKYSQ